MDCKAVSHSVLKLFSVILLASLLLSSVNATGASTVRAEGQGPLSVKAGPDNQGGHRPAVVLIGLKPGIDLRSSQQPGKPFETNSTELDRSLNALRVVRLRQLFADPRSDQARGSSGGTVDLSRVFVLHLPASADVMAAVQLLMNNPDVEYAEPDFSIEAADDPTPTATPSVPTYPNDPRYAEQWALPAIGAPEAWAAMPADAPVITVAVIDSGICADHPDLAGRIQAGWDFVQSDDTPQDDFGHGCSVSGIIAANINNSVGIAGVAPNASIMPLRVLNASGVGSYSDVAAAIVFAADNGAQVINLSLGGSSPSATLEAAVNYAIAKGVIIVAAAGNNGTEGALYPAAYPDVIAVGSVDRDLQHSAFSNYGPLIDIWAPGRDILSTQRDGTYALVTGTSFAAPYVAGAEAVGMPSGLTLAQGGAVLSLVSPSGGDVPSVSTTPTSTQTPDPTPTIPAQVPGRYRERSGLYAFTYPVTWGLQQDKYWSDQDPMTFDAFVELETPDKEDISIRTWRDIEAAGIQEIADVHLYRTLEHDAWSLGEGLVEGNPALVAIEPGEEAHEPTTVSAIFMCGTNVHNVKYNARNAGTNLEGFQTLLRTFSCVGGMEEGEDSIPDLSAVPFVTPPSILEGTGSTCPPSGFYDPTSNWYECGQCTWWASYSRPDVPDDYSWGHAYMWIDSAISDPDFGEGLISEYPEVGAIAVWNYSPPSDCTSGNRNCDKGHVGYVTRTNFDGTFVVTDMNYDCHAFPCAPRERTVTDSSNIRFIRARVVFYEHKEFGGRYEGYRIGQPSIGQSWGISSVFIPAGWEVILYKNTDYDASYWRERTAGTAVDALSTSFWDLQLDYYNNSSTVINDNVHSARVANTTFGCVNPLGGNTVEPLGCTTPPDPGPTVSPPSNPPPPPATNWNQVFYSDNHFGSQCGTRSESDVYVFRDSRTGWSLPGGCPSASSAWSVRMTRSADFMGGDYTFGLFADDGAQLYVDQYRLVDNIWPGTQHYEGKNMFPGTHELRLDYINNAGDAIVQLWWQGPGALPGYNQTKDPNQWWVNYWGNQFLWWDSVGRQNEGTGNINHNWGDGGPGFGIPSDHFSASYERTVGFECGTYRFHLRSDDGSRLKIDGTTVPALDHMVTNVWDSYADVHLAAGNHVLLVDYFEDGGGANLYFDWTKIGNCIPTTPANLHASGVSSYSISLAWDNVANEDGYNIYRWDGASATFVYQNSVGANQTSYTETRTSCGWGQWYEVTSFNSYGESPHLYNVRGDTQPCPVPPPNDDFDAPTTIADTPYIFTQDTRGATQAADDPSLTQCNRLPGQASVWFRYTPPHSGELRVDTSGSDFDTLLAVWTGTRGSLAPVECDDDYEYAAGGEWDQDSDVTANVVGGTAYYIEVSQYNGKIDTNAAEASGLDGKPEASAEFWGGQLVLHVNLADIMQNGGFEEGSSTPQGWISDTWKSGPSFVWDGTQSHSGSRSVKIAIDPASPNDSRWIQTLQVQPNATYRVSGWIKTENVAHSSESVDAGANLSMLGTWERSEGVFGTQDWTYASFLLETGSRTEVTVAARIGEYSGTTTGTAWFDDLRFELLGAPVCHTLTASATPEAGGSVAASPVPNCNSGTQYAHGSVVRLTASPDAGYSFSGWSGDASAVISPAYLAMTGDKAVTANFGPHAFADVPVAGKEWMEPWVVSFYDAGITTGCAANPLRYCPENPVTRAAMAVFILRAEHGASYAPPAASHFFSDLPVAGKEWMEPWVDQYYREGLTTGCGTEPLRYCPENPVTRAAMAVFLLRALEGASYVPPAASHYFADLPVAGKEWMEPWVDEFYRRGITTGCGASPLTYCPENPVTRAAMAVFISRAFGIPPAW